MLVRVNRGWHGKELSVPVGQANRGGSFGAARLLIEKHWLLPDMRVVELLQWRLERFWIPA
ncbi:MAG: hypothetical protein ABGX07_22305, partial [Pirellulaceae bacterium]